MKNYAGPALIALLMLAFATTGCATFGSEEMDDEMMVRAMRYKIAVMDAQINDLDRRVKVLEGVDTKETRRP